MAEGRATPDKLAVSRSGVTVVLAVIAASGMWLLLQGRASQTRFEAGVVFADDACRLSPGYAHSIGGPITDVECARIQRLARAEVAAAFADMRLDITSSPSAFWTVSVRAFIPARATTLGAAGASLAFGPLGGRGTVGLMTLTGYAVTHAPPDVTRDGLVTAIGRGVGRSVVHELAHQIAGGAIDGTDPNTYEYGSVDRASQYYGTLHWGEVGTRLTTRLAR